MSNISQRIELKQGQTLVMTPQLQQSLKLLQYSNQQLAEYIEDEIEKNPLLEHDEHTDSDANKDDDNTKSYEQAKVVKDVIENSSLENISPNDENFDNVWSDQENKIAEPARKSPVEEYSSLHIESKGLANSGFSDKDSYYEKILSAEKTLREHILDQINVDICDEKEKIIALHLLDFLDESGYLDKDFATLQELLKCDITLIETVIEKVQKFNPVGIFARSLAECLAIQLKDKNRFDPAMEKLLNNLNLVADCNFYKLKKVCSVSSEDLSEMCAEIKKLNPRPACNFTTEVTQIAQPDIFIWKNPDGAWSIELNNETLPKLLVNDKYYAEVKNRSKNNDEKNYISEKLASANWLKRSLNQRAETILKVAREIVTQQQTFFESGIHYLRPLVLSDIADAIGMHESTVGRVTVNKYIATQSGIYEMKFFFSSAIHSSHGEVDYSSKTVKHLIKDMIDKERADNVLSDEKISVILKQHGINIARRTVAKYRESMHIPTSSRRKKQKKFSL